MCYANLTPYIFEGRIALNVTINEAPTQKHWTRGLFQIDDSLLYVNRGLGVAGPPIRLNCPREIALLRLVQRT